MIMFLFFLVSLLASALGAACGIGGGILIKPALDALGLADPATASFLSGCTVLAMCLYTTTRNTVARERAVQWRAVAPLAAGAAIGGIAGKQLFQLLAGDLGFAGRAQSACLAALTAGTLVYLLFGKPICAHKVRHPALCALLGAALGLVSGFLGIGGGPVNLTVLFYFFGMDNKTAAQSSLAVILFSQAAALGVTLATRSVPAFRPEVLALMVAGGFLGGGAGRLILKKLSRTAMDRLLLFLMAAIICVCIYTFLAGWIFSSRGPI